MPGRRSSDNREIDREIGRLALPALGALAAEPTYLLVDTAIVGHLGTVQLAALAISAAILGSVVGLCNFLAYATTARVARFHGAGRGRAAGGVAAQAFWLAVGLGLILALAVAAFSQPLAEAINGGGGPEADAAARYLRISVIGLPFALLALSGQGYLRGTGDLRTPLIILVVANVANAALELLLVYGLDWGLDGSAAGTVIAQIGMGVAFALLLLGAPAVSRWPSREGVRPLLRTGGHLFVRTGAIVVCLVLASAAAARFGPVALAANQIALQLFFFLALVLDAVAIAGQVITGRLLGAEDAEGAMAAGRRMITWSLGVGIGITAIMLAGTHLIPDAFTDDQAVIDAAVEFWWVFAIIFPLGSLAFALDGILIGAGDTPFLALAMVAAALVFVPAVLVVVAADWGLVGLWAALNLLMLTRAAPLWLRFRGRRWIVVGA